jgi:SAM-dependent methyltransferase
MDPTVDLRGSLEKLHSRDMVDDHVMHLRFGIGNLLGLPMDIDRFLADCVASKWADLAACLEDITHCQTEVVFLRAASETGISPLPATPNHVVQDALQQLKGQGRTVQVPSSLLSAGDVVPIGLRDGWEQISRLCGLSGEGGDSDLLAAPLFRATAIRRRLERDQLRGKRLLAASRPEELWTIQTALASVLDEVPGYWQLIDQMYQVAQPIKEGSGMLDVGCGIHSFLRLLVLNLSYRLRSQGWREIPPVRYVGVDFSSRIVHMARTAAREALGRLDVMFSGRISSRPPLRPTWILGRSAESLAIATDSFERIVANFSLCFSRSPLHALRELFRVLKPGGKLILSTFTVAADLAQLYRPHLHEIGMDPFAGEARTYLSYMGQLCEAMRTGQLHTFEEDSLSMLIRSAVGVSPSIVQPTASGHILIAVVEKPLSIG